MHTSRNALGETPAVETAMPAEYGYSGEVSGADSVWTQQK